MPITALLALATAAMATGFAWRRTAWFSPATLWSLLCFGNVAVLYAVILWNVHLPSLLISPMPSIRLGDRFAETAAFFAVLSLVGPFATLGLSPGGGRDHATARERLSASLERLGGSRMAALYAIGAAGLAAAHFALIDKDVLLLNTDYLALTDTRRNGLDGDLGTFVNNAFRPLALPAFLLLALRRGPRVDLVTLLLTATAAYALLFSLAIYSRFLMVYVFVYCLGRLLSRRRSGRGVGGALRLAAVGAAVFLAFAVAIAGRGLQIQGVASIGAVLGQLDLGALEYLGIKLVVTTFDGGLAYANALGIEPAYDPLYQRLSFSPLPSLLDGFADVERRLGYRINAYVPVSAYAEARHFHPALTLAFLAICALVTRQATLGFFRHGDVATVALYPAFLLCMLKFQTYSMRTSLRLFVAIAVISWIACALRRRKTADAQPTPDPAPTVTA